MKLLVLAVTLVAILAAMFVAFKPASPREESVRTAATDGGTAVAPPVGATTSPLTTNPQVFDLVVRDGRLVSGPSVIHVRDGDAVTLRLTADTADQLHLHGYDLRLNTRPGETATLAFVARRTGRFGFELHHSGQELGAVEVYPR